MAYEYVLTFQDYLNASQLYLRHRKRARVIQYLTIYLLPVLLLLLDAYWIYEAKHSGEEMPGDVWFVAGEAVAFVLFVYGVLWWQRRRAFKGLLPPGEKTEFKVVFSFDEDGVRLVVPGRNEGRHFWNGIVDFADDDKVFLILVRKRMFVFVPRRAMPEDEWSRLRTLLQANVKKN